MPTLLIVHHTPSPNCQAMFEAVVSGATAPEIEGVRVVRRAAEAVTVTGEPDKAARERCWELGATIAAGLAD